MSILDTFRRRRVEADVRVHPDTGQLGAPKRYHAPAKHSREALHQVQAEAPVERPVRPRDALTIPAVAIQDLAAYRERLLGWAADDETTAKDLRDRAARYRAIAAGYERMLALPQALVFGFGDRYADGPQVPIDERPEPAVTRTVPGACFGCHQVTETRRCWNQLEGREVPLCARCHPCADIDEDLDGEEPERVDQYFAEQLPEAMTPAPPLTGPSAVPGLNGDATKPLPVGGWFRIDDDTLTGLKGLNGGQR